MLIDLLPDGLLFAPVVGDQFQEVVHVGRALIESGIDRLLQWDGFRLNSRQGARKPGRVLVPGEAKG